MLIVAGLIAILLPLLFLWVVWAFDLYSSGHFRTVALCFAWGFVAFGLAFGFNTLIRDRVLIGPLGMDWHRATAVTVVLVAPIAEEILKSLVLIYLGRRPDFTYFVDGAIYGFAAGIGFSVLENFFYIFQSGGSGSQGTMLVVGRSFSTCLMHGSASALVGVAIGLFRYGHGRARLLSAILGWGAAIVLHSAFNRVVEYLDGAAYLLGAVGLGVGGVILIYIFIRWGLRIEKRWIDETLDMQLGVTRNEKSLVLDLEKAEEWLKPVQQRFGKEKTAQVQEFLLKQAQLGIKQKARHLTSDAGDQEVLEEQIAALQFEMDAIRRKVGVYCMTFVRSIFPPESVVMWSSLKKSVAEAQQRPAQFDMWGKLKDSARAQAEGKSGE